MPLLAFFTANGDGLFFCKGAKLRPQQKNTNRFVSFVIMILYHNLFFLSIFFCARAAASRCSKKISLCVFWNGTSPPQYGSCCAQKSAQYVGENVPKRRLFSAAKNALYVCNHARKSASARAQNSAPFWLKISVRSQAARAKIKFSNFKRDDIPGAKFRREFHQKEIFLCV